MMMSATASLGTSYIPTSKETLMIYENILAEMQKIMGDVQPDTLRSATEELLIVLRNKDLTANMQQNNTSSISKCVYLSCILFSILCNDI